MNHCYPASQGGWQKYTDNPVLGGPDIGTCFDVQVLEQPDGYIMYFSWRPHQSLAVATSPDGIHWSAPQIILSPRPESGWEDDINRGYVVRLDGEYHLWYAGQSRGYSRIGYARSSDGLHFERVQSAPVMIPQLPWEKESVYNPCVHFDAETGLFRMWYAGGETYEPNALGYAESTDGIDWRKHPVNPIFVHGKAPYDQARIGACDIHRTADYGYLMFYIGYEDIDTARICMAASPDGITRWRRAASNPILSPTNNAWDASACYKPSVIWSEKLQQWMLWYNGRNGSAEYIGLAIHPGRELEF